MINHPWFLADIQDKLAAKYRSWLKSCGLSISWLSGTIMIITAEEGMKVQLRWRL